MVIYSPAPAMSADPAIGRFGQNDASGRGRLLPTAAKDPPSPLPGSAVAASAPHSALARLHTHRLLAARFFPLRSPRKVYRARGLPCVLHAVDDDDEPRVLV